MDRAAVPRSPAAVGGGGSGGGGRDVFVVKYNAEGRMRESELLKLAVAAGTCN